MSATPDVDAYFEALLFIAERQAAEEDQAPVIVVFP